MVKNKIGEEHKARRGVKTKGMKEEVVNEVSKKTLGSYVKKAATEIGTSAIKGDYKKNAEETQRCIRCS